MAGGRESLWVGPRTRPGPTFISSAAAFAAWFTRWRRTAPRTSRTAPGQPPAPATPILLRGTPPGLAAQQPREQTRSVHSTASVSGVKRTGAPSPPARLRSEQVDRGGRQARNTPMPADGIKACASCAGGAGPAWRPRQARPAPARCDRRSTATDRRAAAQIVAPTTHQDAGAVQLGKAVVDLGIVRENEPGRIVQQRPHDVVLDQPGRGPLLGAHVPGLALQRKAPMAMPIGRSTATRSARVRPR